MVLGKIVAFVEGFIISRLSNNRTFQRFAVRMDDTIQNQRKYIQENIVKNVKTDEAQSNGGPLGFFRNFAAELQKEINQIKNNPSNASTTNTTSRPKY